MLIKQESEPFLQRNSDDDGTIGLYQQRTKRYPLTRYLHITITLGLGLLCIYLTTQLYILKDSCSRNTGGRIPASSKLPFSPAKQAVEYLWKEAPLARTWFSGPPGDDYKAQWSRLLKGTLIRVTKDDLVRAGENESIALKDGGFAAGLAYSHHLHCIKRIKDFMWIQRLSPEIAPATSRYNESRDHADHCIDTLRQHVMCNLDISLNRLQWVPKSKRTGIPIVAQSGPRMCVDEGKIREWMEKNVARSSMFVEPDWDAL